MPIQQGQCINPNGYNGREKHGYRAKSKIQKGLDNAIELLGKRAIDGKGATALGELIAEKLESDVIGTLKALSGILPKQVSVDVHHSASALQMSDEQLLEIIKSRSLPAEKQVNGQVIEHETGNNGQELTNTVINDAETGHY